MVAFDAKIGRLRDVETGQLVSARLFENIGHAAAVIARDAKNSIKTSDHASAAGKPPHTRNGRLRSAIRFDANRSTQVAIVGPIASLVGQSGAAHEFGGKYKGGDFDERPFMSKALERNLHRLAGQFTGSVGG